MSHIVKHKDSPRSLQASRYANGSYGVGHKGKQNASPVDLKESLGVAKLCEASWYNNETKECPRSLYEAKDGSWDTILKDAPRFSYDGQEINHLSFKSRDTIKPTPKQSWETQKRPPSVVAKLMGLEALPDSAYNGKSQPCLIQNLHVEHDNSFSRSLNISDLNRPIQIPKSPRNSIKDPSSPWNNLSSPATLSGKTSNSIPSVYCEIEDRLKDLEFNQSGKDLRALKHILEAMQSKGLLEISKEEQTSNFVPQRVHDPKCSSPGQTPRLPSHRNRQNNHVGVPTKKTSDTLRSYESSIVIMKPAKLVEKSAIPASSVITIAGPHKTPTSGYVDSKKGSINSQTDKDQSPRNSQRDSSASSNDKKTAVKNIKSTQSSARSQQGPKEGNLHPVRSSGSVSSRFQQKRLELEKLSRPPTPPSDTGKPRRQSNRQPTEIGSPGGKHRVKYLKFPESDDQLNQI
ncbi:LONGIFOLIA PROTEIN, partial [Salix viminalis]